MRNFITATKKPLSEFLTTSPLSKSLKLHLYSLPADNDILPTQYINFSHLGEDCRIYIRQKNSRPIGSVYNQLMDCISSDENVIAVHDDVSIEDSLLFRKLDAAHNVYDVVGLAGGGEFVPKSPCLWHICTPREKQSGSVAHFTSSGEAYMTCFGPSPQEVDVVDGLFISIKHTCRQKSVQFNSDIPGFHCYDIRFCMDAKFAGLKIGTWPIWVSHSSPGLSQLTQDFLNCEKFVL